MSKKCYYKNFTILQNVNTTTYLLIFFIFLNSNPKKSIFCGCVLPDVVVYYDKIPQEVFSENLGLV